MNSSVDRIFFMVNLTGKYDGVIILKEKTSFSSIFYILIGFLGILIIIGIEVDNAPNIKYYFYALFGAFLIALVKILIKKLVAYESTLNIQFWFALYSCIFLFFPYCHLAIFPSPKSILNIFFASIFGLLAMEFICSIQVLSWMPGFLLFPMLKIPKFNEILKNVLMN